jgi:NADH-quinone oxidoreductase subunit A
MMFLVNYFSLFVFLLASLLLSSIILLLSLVVSSKADDFQKLSSYECGFNPFDDSRSEFNIKFYIVAILFIIFDLEVSFLFPFAVSFNTVGFIGVLAMLIFLIVLTLGFIYEWQKGALD